MLLWYIILLVLIIIFGILCVGFQHNFLGVSVRYEIPECRFMFYFLCFLGRLLQRSQSIFIYVRYCLSTNVNVSRRFSE